MIGRQLTLKPGELYRRSDVQDSHSSAGCTGWSCFIRERRTMNSGRRPAEVPMRVTVAEGKHQRQLVAYVGVVGWSAWFVSLAFVAGFVAGQACSWSQLSIRRVEHSSHRRFVI